MVAVGSYVRTLREARNLTRSEVAARLRTSEQQIFRIESGEIDTRSSTLLALVAFIRGSAEQVQHLSVDMAATADDGRRMALAWLDESQRSLIERAAQSIPDDHLMTALDVLNELQQRNPQLVDEVIRYGRYLGQQQPGSESPAETPPPSRRRRKH